MLQWLLCASRLLAIEAVQATFGQPLDSQDPIGRAVTVLLAYNTSQRRMEGWITFWQLSDPANWVVESSPGLLALLIAIREHLQSQFQRGEPFAPWPPIVPTLPPSDEIIDPVQASDIVTSPISSPVSDPPLEPTPEPLPTP